MGIGNEDQLYEVVIKKAAEKLRWDPFFIGLIEAEMKYEEKLLNGQRLYLVGETHYSRKPVDFVHERLVPEIQRGPQTWLLLREDAHKPVRDPIDSPTQFYFQELARLFDIPYKEALSSIWSNRTRKYIQRKSGISEVDIDRSLLTLVMSLMFITTPVESPHQLADQLSKIANQMTKLFQKPPEYILKLLLVGSPTDFDLYKTIVKHWNDYSRKRFHRLRREYYSKNNILVSVGSSHLPAFE